MTTISMLEKELEQAYKDLNYYKNRNEKLNNQLQQKENIIKEVREYIENNKEYTTIKKATKNWQYGKVIFKEEDEDILTEDMIKEILEILDKGE